MHRLSIAFASILILIVLAACGSNLSLNSTLPPNASASDITQQGLAKAITELDQDLKNARSMLVYLAAQPQIRTGTPAECITFVKQLEAANPAYAQIGATIPSGDLICAADMGDNFLMLGDTLAYTRAVTAHDFAVGEYVTAGSDSTSALDLAFPILDDGKILRGIVIAPLRMNFLRDKFATITLPPTGEIVLLDTQGDVLPRDPDAESWYGKNISQTPLGSAMLSQIQGWGEFAGADGKTRFYAFGSTPTSRNQLLVAVGAPK